MRLALATAQPDRRRPARERRPAAAAVVGQRNRIRRNWSSLPSCTSAVIRRRTCCSARDSLSTAIRWSKNSRRAFRNGPAVLVGHPTARKVPEGRIASTPPACWPQRKDLATAVQKMLLPNYDVFDEAAVFPPRPNMSPRSSTTAGSSGSTSREDAWWKEPETASYHIDPRPFLDPAEASWRWERRCLHQPLGQPFRGGEAGRGDHRRCSAGTLARHEHPFVFVNQVGGNDDLIFDGNSLVLDPRRRRRLAGEGFDVDYQVVDLEDLERVHSLRHDSREGTILEMPSSWKVAGTTCGSAGSATASWGSRGASTAAGLLHRCQGGGPEHVHGLRCPAACSSRHSVDDAMARQGARSRCPGHSDRRRPPLVRDARTIGEDLSSQPQGLADQNLQARVRGAIVMTRGNRYNWLALATGNKSELAVGYCTLYGDMCGGFAVLSDLLQAGRLCGLPLRQRAARAEVIPPEYRSKKLRSRAGPEPVRPGHAAPPYPILDGSSKG